MSVLAPLSNIVREMLDKPIQFGEPVYRDPYDMTQGIREVVMGPSSPVRGSMHLSNGSSQTAASHEAGSSFANRDRAGTHASPSGTPVKPPLSTPSKVTPPATLKTPAPRESGYNAPLHPSDLDLSWPEPMAHLRRPAAGLYNPSMACYANATLQVLLHTPPVLRLAMEHSADKCESADLGERP